MYGSTHHLIFREHLTKAPKDANIKNGYHSEPEILKIEHMHLTSDQSHQLDSIRGFSAIMVLIGHAYTTFMYPTVKFGYTASGILTQTSVMIFFVLSGFLIGLSIKENKRRNGRFSIKQYAFGRMNRVYPPLIASVLIVWLLNAASNFSFPSGSEKFISIPGYGSIRDGYEFSFLQSIGSAAFLNGFLTSTPSSNGPLWSLSFEVWYYVFAASLAIAKSRPALSVALIFLSLLITSRNLDFFILAPVWACGFWMSTKTQNHFTSNNKAYFSAFCIASIIFALTILTTISGEQTNRIEWTRNMTTCKLTGGAWFSLIMALILSGKLSIPKAFSASAKYSYTLYLIHFPVMLFMFGCTQKLIVGNTAYSAIMYTASIMIIVFLSYSLSLIVENRALISRIIRTSNT